MTHRALLLCMCFAGCTTSRPADLSAILREVEALRAKHELNAALQLADRSLQTSAQRDESYARLCVLKTQVLIQRDGLESGLAFLTAIPAIKMPVSAYILKRQQAVVEADLGRFEDAARDLADAIPLARAAGNPQQVAGTEVARSRILLKLDR